MKDCLIFYFFSIKAWLALQIIPPAIWLKESMTFNCRSFPTIQNQIKHILLVRLTDICFGRVQTLEKAFRTLTDIVMDEHEDPADVFNGYRIFRDFMDNLWLSYEDSLLLLPLLGKANLCSDDIFQYIKETDGIEWWMVKSRASLTCNKQHVPAWHELNNLATSAAIPITDVTTWPY